jgi:putative protease
MAIKKKPAAKKKKKATKPVKKAAVKKPAKKPKEKKRKAIGIVTHFFGGIEVAIVKCKVPMRAGSRIQFKGATTDFEQIIKSMQYEHKAIAVAPKGKEVGIKVSDKVREGDEVYEA